MTYHSKYRFLGVSITLVLWGCTPNLYVPNPTNIPLPAEKNETKLIGSISSAGYCLQSSYALTDHLVAMGTYVGINGTNDSTNLRGINQFGAIGAGYYGIWKKLRYEILGGLGMGDCYTNCNVRSISFEGPGTITGYNVNNNYFSGTFQLDGGVFFKYFETGLSLKMNYLDVFNRWYYIYHLSTDGKIIYSEQSLNLPSNAILFEPAFFLSVGLRYVKFFVSEGYSCVIGPQNNDWKKNNLNLGGYLSEGIMIDLFRGDGKRKHESEKQQSRP